MFHIVKSLSKSAHILIFQYAVEACAHLNEKSFYRGCNDHVTYISDFHELCKKDMNKQENLDNKGPMCSWTFRLVQECAEYHLKLDMGYNQFTEHCSKLYIFLWIIVDRILITFCSGYNDLNRSEVFH